MNNPIEPAEIEPAEIGNEDLGNAIGSTEPTVQERAHFTPEMEELAERDGAERDGAECFLRQSQIDGLKEIIRCCPDGDYEESDKGFIAECLPALVTLFEMVVSKTPIVTKITTY